MLARPEPVTAGRTGFPVLPMPGRRYRAARPLPEWRARSSAGEHYLDMVGVTGSIPVAPTITSSDLASFPFPGGNRLWEFRGN